MIGDFTVGSQTRFGGTMLLDQTLVVADDLDGPNPLPGATSVITITEPGPVGIFDSSLTSIQDVQALLRAGTPLPPATVVGGITDNATLTTAITVGQIQALLASTPEAYDIIPLIAPPLTYDSTVDGVFSGRNTISGSTVLNDAGSGALLQGGVDTLTGGEDFDAYYFYDYLVGLNLLVPQVSGGGVGRLKLAEGGSVLPQDRVYFRYSFFDDVAYRTNGVGMSRFTPGFEHTLLDGMVSVELRMPLASSTVTDVSTTGTRTFGSNRARFGNLAMYLKALLLSTNRSAFSGGLGIQVPTAEDVSVTLAGTPLVNVTNDTVHLQPFLGMLHYWSEDLFCHGFLQFDIVAGHNDVEINSIGTGLVRAGEYSDRDHIFIDYGIGYWLHRDQACTGLTGVIPTLEFHHTSSISGADVVAAGPFTLASGSTSTTNIVAGTTFEFCQNTQLSVAYAGELDKDNLNDGAFRLMLSRQH